MFRPLFGKSNSGTGNNGRQQSIARLALEPLENRDVMSSITFIPSSGTLLINGTTQDDHALVSLSNNGLEIRADLMTRQHSNHALLSQESLILNRNLVDRIVFVGGANDDQFGNSTPVRCEAYGGAGDDILSGGDGKDRLNGGAGADRIYGRAGDDKLIGSTGKNRLYGGDGNDTIYGGSDVDLLFGNNGDDTIVSIGGSVDMNFGGAGLDNVWMDTTDLMTDLSSFEVAQKYIHKVNQFLGVSFSGGITFTPVSKELYGQKLIDPLRNTAHSATTLKSFKTNPLFASDGPSMDDVFQGSVGDCYFVASLSAVAGANPEIVKKMVVELGDGTYAVRFYRNGTPTYVRVDADLWVEGNTPKYAKLGREGSIWAPIIEKAYCFFRKQFSTYPSIASGDGTCAEHLGLAKLSQATT